MISLASGWLVSCDELALHHRVESRRVLHARRKERVRVVGVQETQRGGTPAMRTTYCCSAAALLFFVEAWHRRWLLAWRLRNAPPSTGQRAQMKRHNGRPAIRCTFQLSLKDEIVHTTKSAAVASAGKCSCLVGFRDYSSIPVVSCCCFCFVVLRPCALARCDAPPNPIFLGAAVDCNVRCLSRDIYT